MKAHMVPLRSHRHENQTGKLRSSRQLQSGAKQQREETLASLRQTFSLIKERTVPSLEHRCTTLRHNCPLYYVHKNIE